MFSFKQFTVDDSLTAMKVGTDGVLLGSWAKGGARILDVGTGSGLIALMMAQRFPNATITAIDIDADACRQAKINVDNTLYTNRIKIIHSSLQELAEKVPKLSFDSIVSNPPYFKNSLKSPDGQRSIARHNDTLPFRELISCSKALLVEGGTLSLIGPVSAKDEIESEIIIDGLSVSKLINLQTKINKKPSRFMLQAVKGYADTYDNKTEDLLADDGKRSEWYWNLTKDFYIK